MLKNSRVREFLSVEDIEDIFNPKKHIGVAINRTKKILKKAEIIVRQYNVGRD